MSCSVNHVVLNKVDHDPIDNFELALVFSLLVRMMKLDTRELGSSGSEYLSASNEGFSFLERNPKKISKIVSFHLRCLFETKANHFTYGTSF